MPLTAAELLAHPAYKHLDWKLPATREGYASVAKNRRGGPFKLWYEIHGHGPTRLVFIMGLAAYRTAWKRQSRYFGHDRADQYSVLVFDNRGIGKSDKPTTRYSTHEMAADVVDLLEAVGWLPQPSTSQGDGSSSSSSSSKVNIIGVSLGGMISQELGLLLPPGTVNSLVLCSTAARLERTMPYGEYVKQRVNMFIPRGIDAQISGAAQRIFSPRFLQAPDTEADEPYSGGPEGGNFPTNRDRYCAGEVQKHLDHDGFTPKGFVLQAVAAGWHHKSAEQLAALAYRVGRRRIAVCHGTQDNMITLHHANVLHQDLGEGIEFKIWDDAGHVLLWEVVDEFNAWLAEFIQRQDAVDT